MGDRFSASRAHQVRAKQRLASGVATAFRASQRPVPICFERGDGAHLTDVDGNRYVDYALAFGPMLLGHSPAPILNAVEGQLRVGLGYGACHRAEAELAEAVCRTVPSAEMAIFSSTGSEAVHAAIRIARAATGRTRVIKFRGHYHGWFDPIYIGVGGAKEREPGTVGQDPAAADAVTVCEWNDLDALKSALAGDVAAVIMEPVNVNSGCLRPKPDYLSKARELIQRAGALLIFDEVITGYRLALGGAQEHYGIRPDLTVLGKALGGGLPISAVCGSNEVMEQVASFRVGHVGTFNANPICASAALAAVQHMEKHASEIYPHLTSLSDQLARGLVDAGAEADVPIVVNHVTGVVHVFVSSRSVASYDDTLHSDAEALRRFTQGLLEEGVHVIPKGLMYVSAAHTAEDVEATVEAARRALATVRTVRKR